MIDGKFEKFLILSIQNCGEDYFIVPAEWRRPHEFSSSFEKNMNSLIGKQKRFCYPHTKIRLKKILLVVAVMVVFLVTTVLGVGALRSTFYNFILNYFPTHVEVRVASEEERSAPNVVYRIDPIPEKYSFTYQTPWRLEDGLIATEYRRNSEYVIFAQHLQSSYHPDIRIENSEITFIDLRGHHGFIIASQAGTYLAWQEDGYVFSLSGDVDQDILLKFAVQVRK